MDVALAQLGPRQPGSFEVGAGDRQHGVARIDADGAQRARADELQHAAGAGAKVEEGADRAVADCIPDGSLHRLLRRMQRADAVPIRGKAGKERLRRLGAGAAHGGQPRPVGGKLAVGGIKGCYERLEGMSGAATVSQPKERPGAFAVALDQPRFGKKLKMARNARLRLAENVSQVADIELAVGKQRQNTQSRLLPGRLQAGEQDIQRE
jgi:hypothetical protein